MTSLTIQVKRYCDVMVGNDMNMVMMDAHVTSFVYIASNVSVKCCPITNTKLACTKKAEFYAEHTDRMLLCSSFKVDNG